MENLLAKVKLYWSKVNRWYKVLAIFLIVELRWIPEVQLGFECNDPALSYTFRGDTIDWKRLIFTTAFTPLAVMLLVERKSKGREQALLWYKEYLFGFFLNVTVVQTIKLLVGAPRPHFFDTCEPEEALSCLGTEYVSRYTCRVSNWQHQSDKSFPSGHTSMALHAAVFIAYYLRCRFAARASGALQLCALALGAACGASRVADRRHHGRDVLAGAAVAAPVLLYTISTLCKNFECSYTEETKEDINPIETKNVTETVT